MAPAQRIRAALRNEPVDRVPVSPDCSMMMPARHTGRPYWEVFLNDNPPLWKARIDLERALGSDLIFGCNGVEGDAPGVTVEKLASPKDETAWIGEEITHTPHGELRRVVLYPADKSPWTLKPILSDPDDEVDALLSTLADPSTCRLAPWYAQMRAELADLGCVFGIMSVPLAWWLYQRADLQLGLMDFYDRKALVERALAVYGDWALEWLEAQLTLQRPDFVMFGGSVSSMSVASPDLYRRYAYPWLKRACEIAARHETPAAVHMCGKCRAALDMLVDAGVTMIEPLEAPPSGDVTLAEVCRRHGPNLVLKGNVNTFNTLARGTPEMVIAEARRCIRDAGRAGFILSTGDQVPGDTPYENLRALVSAVRDL
jgi:uroporphyrinogen-III decarboxylase